jgi:hypothetical protein
MPESDVLKNGTPGVLAWHYDMPLLTNRFVLYDTGRLLLLTGAVCAVLAGFIAIVSQGLSAQTCETLAVMLKLFGVCLLVVLAITMLVMLVFFGNRFPMRFELSEREVAVFSESRRGKAGNRAAIVLGILASLSGRRNAALGAGLLAVSRETERLKWTQVKAVNYYPAQRVISIRNRWRTVMRLYCTAENYEHAAEAVRRSVS